MVIDKIDFNFKNIKFFVRFHVTAENLKTLGELYFRNEAEINKIDFDDIAVLSFLCNFSLDVYFYWEYRKMTFLKY